MNDLDTRLREALDRDAARAPEPPATWTGPVLATSPRDTSRRSRTLVGSVAAGSMVVAGVAALAWWPPSDTSPSIEPAATPDPPATTIWAAEEEARREEAVREAERRLAEAERRRAEVVAADELAAAVAGATAAIGWNGPLTEVRSAGGSVDGPTLGFAEVRVADPDIAGELFVSVSTGDADAVTSGRDGHGEPLRADGANEIYLGTDSDAARAVELFDLDTTTILYVRSESADARARSVDDLITLALDINARSTN
jgi:hypothetical protein